MFLASDVFSVLSNLGSSSLFLGLGSMNKIYQNKKVNTAANKMTLICEMGKSTGCVFLT